MWLGELCAEYPIPSPLSEQRWKEKKEEKQDVDIPAPSGKLALKVNSYPREAGLCPNPGNINHSAVSAYL